MARYPTQIPLRLRRFFLTGEVAGWIGVTSQTVAAWIDAGKMKATIRHGPKGERVRFVPRSEAARVLRARGIPVLGVWPRFPTLLFVHPDAAVRRAIQRHFERHKVPIEVRLSGSPPHAMRELASVVPPAALVLDSHAAGRPAVKDLRAYARRRGIPIVILTGTSRGHPGPILPQRNVRDVIEKPITIEAFKDRIWPLLFDKDPRGEKERRRRIEAVMPG